MNACLSGTPYWLVVGDATKLDSRQLDVFSFDFEGEKLMPVFSDAQQAETFAWSATPDLPEAPGWRPRLSSSGELISLLSRNALDGGPCAGVRRIVLDPSAEAIGSAELHFISMSRERFLEHLSGHGGGWFEEEEREKSRRKTAGFKEIASNDGKEKSGAIR